MKLIVEHRDARSWRLVWPLTWRDVVVPAGFETDLASTPRFLWPLLPPTGRYAGPAVVHDYLYWIPTGRSRAEVDRLFLDAMQDAGVPRWQRWLLYAGVRIGGFHRGHWSR